MDTTVLVESDKRAGAEVVRCLDEAHVTVKSAFWWYDPEAGEWQLVIVTPLVNQVGPRATYDKIQRALSRRTETVGFPLWRIAVKGTEESPWKDVRSVVRTAPGDIAGFASSNTSTGRSFLGDLFVYRSS